MQTPSSFAVRARVALVVGAIALAWHGWPIARAAAPYDPALYSGLRWRMLGPFRGGRVDAVSGVPGRPNEFYFGSVNGGVWKTINAGRTWMPVFDAQPVASIGALAVAPSSPDTIYVGSVGAVDVEIDPVNSQVVYASLWNTRRPPWYAYAPSNGPGGGIYRSTDGGTTWKQLTAGLPSEGFGRSGIAIAPGNPRRVYAV